MQLNIEKNNFYKMNTLSSIKAHQSVVRDVKIEQSKAFGNIEISLYYYDLSNKECFEKIVIPFELDMEGLDIIEIKLVKTNTYVIEGNGINVEYELEVEYEFINDVVPIEIIKEEDIELINDKEQFDQIKEETKEYYEEMLSENLRENVKVISTLTDSNPDEFLTFFEDKISYYKLKCIYVDSELEFNDISTRYGVSIESLWAGYDKENKKVIFKVE